MKNLYLLPTPNPSRLHYWDGILKINNSDIPLGLLYQNIYITNDEVIKEGDYGLIGKEVGKIILTEDGYEFLIGKGVSYEYGDYHSLQKVCKKIILATDQDLIKNGVQPIEDEFLEWFVQNSSCERVDVEKWFEKDSDKEYFIIIIPQEEIKRKIDTCYNFDMEIGCVQDICRCEQEEAKQSDIKELNKLDDIEIEEMSNDWETISKQKEAYNKIYKEIDFSEFDFSSFAIGVKYQQEKMYSEEEVKRLAFDFYYDMSRQMGVAENLISENATNVDVWFEQFKKK
jgi:hypothetical protein